MGGCQSDLTNEEIPQDEVQIDTENNETNNEEINNDDNIDESKANEDESKAADEAITNKDEIDEKSVATPDKEEKISKDIEDLVVTVPSEEVEFEINEPELLGGIPNSEIKGGIIEACTVLYNFKSELNADDLEVMEFENIYEKYWVQKYPLNTLDGIRDRLQLYFTEDVAQDIIEKWGLIEYQGQVLAPELPNSTGYDPETLEPKLAEVDENTRERFISLGFIDDSGASQRTLVVLKRTEDDNWKLDTIPGTGIVKQHGNAIIRNKFWVDKNMQWEWPDFIASEDLIWESILKPLQDDLKDKTTSVLQEFVPEEHFEAIGASQLSYWTTWGYTDYNPSYPSVDIILSEYMKYGFHPNHVRMTVNLSKEKGTALILSDLYSDKESFYETVNVYIDKYMRENPEGFYNDVVFEGIEEQSQFYISDNGITFYFQLYEYAPYAFGFPEIEVPFKALKDSLSPDFLKFVEMDSKESVKEEVESDTIVNTDESIKEIKDESTEENSEEKTSE